MKEERFFYVPDAFHTNNLPEDEAKHAIRVLRLKEADEIFLMDGIGNFYKAEITMISNIYNCEFISLGIIAKFVLTLYIFFLIISLKITLETFKIRRMIFYFYPIVSVLSS